VAFKGDGVVDGRRGIDGLGFRFWFRIRARFRIRAGSAFAFRTGPGIRAGTVVVYGGVAGRDKEAQEYEKDKKKTT
jgi:hypothetical protein